MAPRSMISRAHRLAVGVPRYKWAKFQMERSGLNALLAHRPENAIPPSYFDLWTLYRAVRLTRPEFVVEFGVGSSSYVIAEGLHRNGSGTLHSIDASERWISETEGHIPAHLRKHLHLHHSTVSVMELDGSPCHRYETVPQGFPIDMIFLDGPAPADVPGWTKKRPLAADPVLLEGRFRSGFQMIVDARLDNVAFLKQHLRKRYDVKTDHIFAVTKFSLKS